MYDLKEQLSSARIEDEDSPIYRFSSEITLKCLVNSHTIHVGIINKPYDLVCEEIRVVL